MNEFKKNERVINFHLIKKLLEFKNSFNTNNFIVSFYVHNMEEVNNLQILISVPKKKIKLAVKRNKIKRLMRESYRLQKDILLDNIVENKKLVFLLIYNSEKTNINFEEVFRKINLILLSLKKSYNEII